jgi:hypothetical protein
MLQLHIAPYSNLDLQADYKIGRKLHSRKFIALVNQMRPMQWCLLVAVFAAISFFIISYRTLKRCGICFILGIQSLPRNHISSQAYNAWMGSAMKKT